MNSQPERQVGRRAIDCRVATTEIRTTGHLPGPHEPVAHQVIEEARSLGIDTADITGARSERDAAAVGRYKTAEAIGITTYSNLFNSNPIVVASDVLVLDDVHSGGQHVISNWTVRVSKTADRSSTKSSSPRSGKGSQTRNIASSRIPSAYQVVELCIAGHPECLAALTAALDGQRTTRCATPGHHPQRASGLSSARLSVRPRNPPI